MLANSWGDSLERDYKAETCQQQASARRAGLRMTKDLLLLLEWWMVF